MVTTYFKNVIMGTVFGTKTDVSLPSAYYLALSSTEPQADGTGVTEPASDGSGYSRILLNSLSPPNNGEIHNTSTLDFASTTIPWGVQRYYAIFDSAISGNLLYASLLEPARNIHEKALLRFGPGSISIALQDPFDINGSEMA